MVLRKGWYCAGNAWKKRFACLSGYQKPCEMVTIRVYTSVYTSVQWTSPEGTGLELPILMPGAGSELPILTRCLAGKPENIPSGKASTQEVKEFESDRSWNFTVQFRTRMP